MGTTVKTAAMPAMADQMKKALATPTMAGQIGKVGAMQKMTGEIQVALALRDEKMRANQDKYAFWHRWWC